MSALTGISALVILAAAQPAAGLPVRVVWDAPAGCSDAESFYAAVLSRAERAHRAEPGEEGVRVEVKLARLGPKVHGELRLVTGDGRSDLRKVDGATCDEVAAALSLTAALALSGSAPEPTAGATPAASTPNPQPSVGTPSGAGTAAPVAPSPSPAVATPPAVSPPSPVPAPPAAVPPVSPPEAPEPARPPGPPAEEAAPGPSGQARPFWSWLAGGAGPAGGEAVEPHFGLGGQAFLRLEEPEADRLVPSVALGFVYLRNGLLGGGDGAVFGLAAATLTACPGWGWWGGIASVELCALGLAGRLSASDGAVTVGRSVTRSWWSAGAVLQVQAPVGQGFAVQLDASASVPVVERRFVTTTPEQTVGTTPRVAPMFALSLVHGL